MALMKTSALRDMTRDELTHRVKELTDESFNLKMRRTLKQLDNPLRLRIIRREVARIMTALQEDSHGVRPLAEAATTLLGDKKKK